MVAEDSIISISGGGMLIGVDRSFGSSEEDIWSCVALNWRYASKEERYRQGGDRGGYNGHGNRTKNKGDWCASF